MLRFACLRTFPLVLLFVATISRATGSDVVAAHFFTYRPTAGQQAKFEDGYRHHLDWHRRHHDPLVWYGWTIEDGPHEGLFVDASVGDPFASFDRRVDPRGDGADFRKTALPYATPVQRASYVLLRELSTGSPLEQRQPSRFVQVIRYRVHPGMNGRFEHALRIMHDVLAGMPKVPPHSWYRLTVGGTTEYMQMVARNDWASYDRFNLGPGELLGRDPTALHDFTEAVSSADSETWRYRADLSYLPQPGASVSP